jgi:cobalamin biosynthesis protein CobD/CbiB
VPDIGIAHIGTVLLLFFYLVLHMAAGAVWRRRSARAYGFWQLIRGAAAELERRLNRSGRTDRQKSSRGFLIVIVMMFFGVMIGVAADRVAVHAYGWVAQLLLLSAVVTLHAPLKLLRDVAAALEKSDTKSAVALLQPVVPHEELSKADRHTLARRALEHAAVAANRYLVAPCFYFALFGGTGMMVYVVAVSLHDAFADEPVFGRSARICERVISFVPSRIAAFSLSLAGGFVSRSNPLRAMGVWLGQGRDYLPSSQGVMVAAMAGALGVRLGGMQRQSFKWIGTWESSAMVTAADVSRGAMLCFVSFLCELMLLSVGFIALYKFS